MKIHLRQIPQGGTLHVEGVEDAGFLELEEAAHVRVRLSSMNWTWVSPAAASSRPAVSACASA